MPYPAVVFWQKLSVLRKQSAVAFALLGGQGDMPHKCELKQAILVKLLYGTRYSGFFGIAFFLTNNVNTFYL